EIKTILMPPDASAHAPLVTAPSGTVTRGMLATDLGLVFPFGFFVLGLRFLLRMLLALSGHVSIDPDEAHKEDLGRASAENAANDDEHRAPAGAGGGA